MPNPRTVVDTVCIKFSDNEILQRVAERLNDGSMAFKVDIVGGLSLTVGDINIGAVNILNAADQQINPARDESLQAILNWLNGATGDAVNVFDEQAGVAAGAPTDIVAYTVPVGKTLMLRHAMASGSNVSQYWVEVNGVKQASKRSYFTDYNVDFFFEGDSGHGLKVSAGQEVKVVGLHNRTVVGDFEASLSGRLT